MKISRKQHRGYTPLYGENLDFSNPNSKGDWKEIFCIGRNDELNQWPSAELLPTWRANMEAYCNKVIVAGIRLMSLIALALNSDEDYFDKIGAFDGAEATLCLLHYPGELEHSEEERFGASAHSDYGSITLLVSDGVPGLQVCQDQFNETRIWKDVSHMDGAFIVNIGDMMERWTNCLFRSTLHRVMPVGQERYSMAFFLDPNPNCVVQCLESCCSDSYPQRFPPIRSGDYLKERFRLINRLEL